MRRFRLYELSHRIDSLIDRNISINDIRNFKKKKKKESLELQMKLNSTILKNTFLFRKINKAKKRTKKRKVERISLPYRGNILATPLKLP